MDKDHRWKRHGRAASEEQEEGQSDDWLHDELLRGSRSHPAHNVATFLDKIRIRRNTTANPRVWYVRQHLSPASIAHWRLPGGAVGMGY
jgi:hypothetical protein